MSKKEKTIVEEMDEFRDNLIRYNTLRRKIIGNESLTDEEETRLLELYYQIGTKCGKYEQLIREITNLTTIHTSAGPQDVWNWALSTEPNTLVTSALDNCVSATFRTIGTVQKDIDNGLRDPKTGKLLSPVGTRKFEVPKAFISHGKESAALKKLENFLHNLGVLPLIVKEQPSLDKTVPDKVEYYLQQSDFVIILATGDDEFEGKLHPRQNVIHEIGLAQQTHSGKIIYLLEEGAEFPSNISPKVWERFKQRNMLSAFLCILRELRALGILLAVKPQE